MTASAGHRFQRHTLGVSGGELDAKSGDLLGEVLAASMCRFEPADQAVWLVRWRGRPLVGGDGGGTAGFVGDADIA
jgi:hypothetical protein